MTLCEVMEGTFISTLLCQVNQAHTANTDGPENGIIVGAYW